MEILTRRDDVREWVAAARAQGRRIAFVPTMGALHRGHASLIEAARGANVQVVTSIFVNPLQFGPTEDLERYPRDLEGDARIAEAAGAHMIFAPSVAEMYPAGEPWIAVVQERGADRLCGRSRPGHFRGVLTVVAKLFGIVAPDVALFGRKDYQQLLLVRRMVEDLEMGITIQGVPTVREPDGLALSSRNRYLTPEQRRRALALVTALRRCVRLYETGESDPRPYLELLHKMEEDGVSVDYAEVVDPASLEPVERVDTGVVCAVAAWVDGTRLIDNVALGQETLP